MLPDNVLPPCRSSRREGERSGKRKRHHAEHAEPEASLHEPTSAGPVSIGGVAPASDARVTLEATDEVISPSKRVPLQVNNCLPVLRSCDQAPGCVCCCQLELMFAGMAGLIVFTWMSCAKHLSGHACMHP